MSKVKAQKLILSIMFPMKFNPSELCKLNVFLDILSGNREIAIGPGLTCTTSIYSASARTFFGQNNQRIHPTFDNASIKRSINEQLLGSGASDNKPLIWLLQMISIVTKENSKGNKTVPEKVATTCTEDGHKQTTKTSTTI